MSDGTEMNSTGGQSMLELALAVDSEDFWSESQSGSDTAVVLHVEL